MTDNNPIITIRDVCFSYGQVEVIKDITLDVQPDDFLGLIGPNGGGKTTLLKLILGFLRPSKGTITVFGEPPRIGRRQIGYVPQYANFDHDFPATVKEVVLTGRLGHARLFRRYSAQDREAVQEALELVNMTSLADRGIAALSGGERQRVLVARALVTDPKVLLLDEPTASVDSSMEKQFYESLKELNQRIPVVLVSHDVGFISSYITRVACINQRLVANPVDEIHAHDIESLYTSPVRMWSHDCEL